MERVPIIEIISKKRTRAEEGVEVGANAGIGKHY
jgi:hypothetical protein